VVVAGGGRIVSEGRGDGCGAACNVGQSRRGGDAKQMDKAGEGDAELKGEEKLKIRKNEKEKVTEKRKKKREGYYGHFTLSPTYLYVGMDEHP
jgi:hypothetical protein